jgi:hypothetical protein
VEVLVSASSVINSNDLSRVFLVNHKPNLSKRAYIVGAISIVAIVAITAGIALYYRKVFPSSPLSLVSDHSIQPSSPLANTSNSPLSLVSDKSIQPPLIPLANASKLGSFISMQNQTVFARGLNCSWVDAPKGCSGPPEHLPSSCAPLWSKTCSAEKPDYVGIGFVASTAFAFYTSMAWFFKVLNG